MNVKKIYIELEDGRTFSLPVHVVAADRAAYYAQRDKDTTYQEEYDYAMSDMGEDCMMDWFHNNFDWYEHNPTLEGTAPYKELKHCVPTDFTIKED